MNKKGILFHLGIIALLMLVPLKSLAQVAFIEVTTEEEMKAAQQMASDRMQMLFVDVYATWCGPCKMMDRDVYPEAELSSYMNENFVSVRMDGETPFGTTYAREHQLQGYPSMFVFSDDGELIHTIVGYNDAASLLSTLKLTGTSYSDFQKFHGRYLQGELEHSELPAYIEALNGLDRKDESEKVVEEYAAALDMEHLTDQDIRILVSVTDVGDSWWKVFSEDWGRLQRIFGESFIDELGILYSNSLSRAVEEENPEMVAIMARDFPRILEELSGSLYYNTIPFIQYFYYTEKYDELVNYVNERYATDRKDDHEWLFTIASHIASVDQQKMTNELLVNEVNWYSTCIELKEVSDYYFHRGLALFFLEKLAESKADLDRALELASTDEEKQAIQQVLSYVSAKLSGR